MLLNVSILYGIKYYLYNQANKQVDDMGTIVLNKIKLHNENIDLSDTQLFSDTPSKENIFINIVQGNGKSLNISNKFNYNIQIEEPFDEIRIFEEHNKRLVYKNLRIENKEYGVVYVQIVKDMDNEYDFLKVLFAFMAIADFLGIIASIVLGQNQFVADASHELRTPIAVIKGYANLLDRWGKDDREALEEIKNKTVKITVSDSGIGIPKEEIKSIFERFYTVDKSRSKEKGGTGLGLSIAKWIVDVHGGALNVESEEGKGTKIIIILNI